MRLPVNTQTPVRTVQDAPVAGVRRRVVLPTDGSTAVTNVSLTFGPPSSGHRWRILWISWYATFTVAATPRVELQTYTGAVIGSVPVGAAGAGASMQYMMGETIRSRADVVGGTTLYSLVPPPIDTLTDQERIVFVPGGGAGAHYAVVYYEESL